MAMLHLKLTGIDDFGKSLGFREAKQDNGQRQVSLEA